MDELHRMGAFDEAHEVPIIVRGEGCYVVDQHGRRYLDGLSALYCVNIGHGRAEVAQAGPTRPRTRLFDELGLRELRAIESPPGSPASRTATSTASSSPRAGEAVDSALKLCRQYHKLTGNPGRYKVISRKLSPTTARRWGRSPRPASRTPAARSSRCSPARPTWPTRTPTAQGRGPGGGDPRADRVRGPETVSCVILEPVQNSGGCFCRPRLLPEGPRDLRRARDPLHLRRGHLLWGRLGEWFGAQRFGYLPDLITTAKGLTSAYAPMGAVIASDKVFAPFKRGRALLPARHHLRRAPRRGGHRAGQPRRLRVRAAAGPRARQRGRVRGDAGVPARHPDRRRRPRHGVLLGAGTRQGPPSKETFSPEECEWLCAGTCPPRSSRAADLPRGRPRRPGDHSSRRR